MHPIRRRAGLALIATLSLGLLRCGGDAAGPKSCAEIGDEATLGASTTEPAFKVIHPNGGQTFKVGDSITVRLGANSQGTSALAYLVIESLTPRKRLLLPGTPSTRDINPRATCEYSFRIPDTITELGTTYSLVSDAVRIRVAAYNNETLYNDESDATFKITR